MPCWYFERKEIKNSPSLRDGIDSNTESRYRREGARFILDAGTKMMLRYDTCATGVVYFHRFYMYHSFKDFYRYVTAACCLFLAGKVEETPKKCKDIVKTAQMLLSPASFQRFGEDPREELMMMERILLKTIKFDLQVEHPYFHMLKIAKLFKGSDKEKTQKMAQMAWTFINDSLCTTLCLQWEPEIIAVALMYLASRLTKFEPTEWSGRTSSRSKWWEDFIEGMSLELMEDICHQVLDLYSNKQSKKGAELDSPPQTPSKQVKESPPPPPPPDRPQGGKRSREVTPSEPESVNNKSAKHERELRSSSKSSSGASHTTTSTSSGGAPIPVAKHISSQSQNSGNHISGSSSNYMDRPPPGPEVSTLDFNSFNPYVSSQMFSSSFLSQEGSQNIQSILAGTAGPPPTTPGNTYPPPEPHHHHSGHPMSHDPTASSVPPAYYPPPPIPPTGDMSYSYPPPPTGSQYSLPPPHSYPPPPTGQPIPTGAPPPTAPPPSFDTSYPPSYPPPSYPPPPLGSQPPVSSYAPPQTSYSLPPPSQSYGGYPYPPTGAPPTNIPPPQFPPSLRDQPPPTGGYASQPPPNHQPPHSYGGHGHGGGGNRHRGYQKHGGKHNSRDRKDIPALTEIKITGPAYYKE